MCIHITGLLYVHRWQTPYLLPYLGCCRECQGELWSARTSWKPCIPCARRGRIAESHGSSRFIMWGTSTLFSAVAAPGFSPLCVSARVDSSAQAFFPALPSQVGLRAQPSAPLLRLPQLLWGTDSWLLPLSFFYTLNPFFLEHRFHCIGRAFRWCLFGHIWCWSQAHIHSGHVTMCSSAGARE